MAFTFKKSEKLCSKKVIEQLFSKGNSGFTLFPFRFLWVATTLDSGVPTQILITVSKKNFPKSTQRNRIKRQIRELYRTNKEILYTDILKTDKQFALMISYLAKDKMLYQDLSKIFHQSILRLKSDLK